MATKDDAPTRQQDDFFTVLSNAFRLIGKSWDALLLNLNTFLLVGLVPIVAFAAFLFLPLIVAGTGSQTGAEGGFEWFGDAMGSMLAGFLFLTLMIFGSFVILWATIALIVTQLASVRGQKIEFKEAVNKAKPFLWRFLGLAVVTALLVIGGIILLIIPGVLAAFFLSFSTYLMIDKNLGVIDSVKGSYELVKQNWKLVLSYYIVSVVISLPQVVPILGWIASLALTVAYFCLPAILYVRSNHSPAKA